MTNGTTLDDLEESMNQSVGKYMQALAKQGKKEGRLVMHDEHGQPVAALVLFRQDVAERLHHLDKFVETTTNYFSTSIQ
jgi:tetrahydromethanopterin S-methyltransferase subunit G